MKRREELDKYHDLSEEELRAETARLKESLFRLKFKLALAKWMRSSVFAKRRDRWRDCKRSRGNASRRRVN
jgi:ribosomal protein L29